MSPPSAAFRARFPDLARMVHLSSCGLGARSEDLADALWQLAEDMGLGGGAWERFEAEVTEVRHGFAELVGAEVDQIALMPNATVGAYQVASTMDWTARPGIISAAVEFPSIAHVWLAQRSRGATVTVAGSPARYRELVDRRTRLVSVPLVSYADARLFPVAELAAAAHDAGADVFVDAYQALGVLPVDVDRLGCDFLVGGSMKYLLGLPGLAFLYARDPERLDRLPTLTGWFGRGDPMAFDPSTLDFPARATRFETGTPSVPACYAANAGLRLVASLDLAEVHRHVLGLTELARTSLVRAGERVRAPAPAERGAHIGLVDEDPAALAAFLAARGVSVSPRGDVVRVSFHLYNNAEDVAALCAAVGDRRSSVNRNTLEPRGRSHVHS